MRFAARTILTAGGVALAVAGCRPATDAVSIVGTEELPGPPWSIGARRDGRTLLIPGDGGPRGLESARHPRSGEMRTQTLLYSRGGVRPGPWAARTALSLPNPPVADSVDFFVVNGFAGGPVVLFQPVEGSPLRERPGTPGTYLLERHDRLWLVTADRVEQLTADAARGIARDSLAPRVREEGPHLFWASAPVWSPDGSRVAYVTNRSWMLSPRGGQEIWLVDVRTRAERPLLSEEGRSFYPDGWFGDEVVFRSDEPGFAAVRVTDARRRAIANGSPVAFAEGRLLYMTQHGERWRAHILSANGTEEVPAPPQGELLVHGGAFSPSGERVLLETALEADSGITRALYLYEAGTRRLSPLLRWNHREEERTPVGLPHWVDETTLLLRRVTRVSRREMSALLHLSR